MGKHSRREDLADEVQDDGPQLENDVGKHSRERLMQEARVLDLAGGHRISAVERELLDQTLYQILVGHRTQLLAQRAELVVRLSDLLAEVERLDSQLDVIERSQFWRRGKD